MTELYNLSDEELLAADVPVMTEEPEVTEHTEEPSEQEQSVPNDDTKISEESNQEAEVQQTEPQNATEVDEAAEAAETQIDYQAFYETMTKPFKANGRDIQITNTDDAIRLMQMGVNYSKKMESLKPNLALLKFLESNGLTDKEELGYLLDLKNKKPEAIAKLISDGNIDLYELDTSIAENYTPTVEVNEPSKFETVLEEVLTDTPQMSEVLQQMHSWDNQSKSILYEQPEILTEIAKQKATGFYDKVVNVIENERLFGRMVDMNYLEAYAQVEAMLMQSENKFVAPRPTNKTTNPNKQKASVPAGTAKAENLNEIDLYALSDEELLKLKL